MRPLLLALVLCACGGGPDPMLRNVPQPKTSAVAGAAAAIAGAATLAAPDSQAARVQEANKPDESDKPMKPGPNVPADVLDRLDEQDPQAPAAPPPSERRPAPKGKKAPVKSAPKPTHPPQTTLP